MLLLLVMLLPSSSLSSYHWIWYQSSQYRIKVYRVLSKPTLWKIVSDMKSENVSSTHEPMFMTTL